MYLIFQSKIFNCLDYIILSFKFSGEIILERKLQVIEPQIRKVIQLHETMIVRWGVMLVGPTGGGKTIVLHVSLL